MRRVPSRGDLARGARESCAQRASCSQVTCAVGSPAWRSADGEGALRAQVEVVIGTRAVVVDHRVAGVVCVQPVIGVVRAEGAGVVDEPVAGPVRRVRVGTRVAPDGQVVQGSAAGVVDSGQRVVHGCTRTVVGHLEDEGGVRRDVDVVGHLRAHVQVALHDLQHLVGVARAVIEVQRHRGGRGYEHEEEGECHQPYGPSCVE